MRHWLELSMTTAPSEAAAGARISLASAPAEKRAMSTSPKAPGLAALDVHGDDLRNRKVPLF